MWSMLVLVRCAYLYAVCQLRATATMQITDFGFHNWAYGHPFMVGNKMLIDPTAPWRPFISLRRHRNPLALDCDKWLWPFKPTGISRGYHILVLQLWHQASEGVHHSDRRIESVFACYRCGMCKHLTGSHRLRETTINTYSQMSQLVWPLIFVIYSTVKKKQKTLTTSLQHRLLGFTRALVVQHGFLLLKFRFVWEVICEEQHIAYFWKKPIDNKLLLTKTHFATEGPLNSP